MMTDFYNFLIEVVVFLAVSLCVWILGGIKDE